METIKSKYRASNGDIVEEEYTLHIRSLREWVVGLVKEPSLAPFFQWYPIRKYCEVSGRRQQFVDEPWTGSDWWDDQVSYCSCWSPSDLMQALECCRTGSVCHSPHYVCRQDNCIIIQRENIPSCYSKTWEPSSPY